MLAIFDDAATIRAAIAFERALARAQADAGLIPPEAADRVVAACAAIDLDPATLAEEAAFAGTLAIPLVARLKAAGADAAHHGATSQDLADTILALQMRAGVDTLLPILDDITTALAKLARSEAATPAMGRTLLQDALPIGFGLRVAHWAAGIGSARTRLAREANAACALQLGGGAGTREGLAGHGQAVAAAMASALGLTDPGAPWHGRRGDVAGLAAALGIVIGALGKFARDVSLLAMTGLGEAREPAVPGRGGSSAMAHKRNPTACQVALSAAIRAPGLVATIFAAMPQELERGLGGWQAEAPVIADIFALAAGAAEAMAPVSRGIEIDREAIAANLAATGQQADIGESVALVDALLHHIERG